VDRKLTQRQGTLFKFFKRSIIYALAKAIKLKLLPFNEDWYKWSATMPKSPSIDLGREATAAIELYKMGANTLSDIYGLNGQDWEAKIIQKIKERKRMEELCKTAGVDINAIQQLTPNGNASIQPQAKPGE
jgi:hypothetical protein